MKTGTIYSIETTDKRDELNVSKIGTTDLKEQYSYITVIKTQGSQYLLGYDKTTGKTDAYLLSADAPFLTKTDSQLNFGEKMGSYRAVLYG